ncbi:Acg family FMN-binding oxidoreductase [Rhizobium alvei]|uniref:Twin-arginine translocation pathway signal protein n=1 Tax=Rhizobium alvei TaxID=1132659 RepID=A0ABT8YI13_9HYPH|nr:twin-arginine translocation pathway signal protein [Rhizobium alvei]MDO6963328.1 twin-arginine translocation pathway signal protein [Rhizobium alvei]
MNRRNFMLILGGGVITAAAATTIWVLSRQDGDAQSVWDPKKGAEEADLRRWVLSHAILAPNPHNRQPWIADLGTADEITLYCQKDRRLPETDPFDRQITIGLGAFLELLSMAAMERGFRAEIALFPEGEPQPRLDERPVAHIRLVRQDGLARDPLFQEIYRRRTNRSNYDIALPVPKDSLKRIAAASRHFPARYADDPTRVGDLRSLAWAAMETEFLTPGAAKESVDLMRIGRSEIAANPDGIAIDSLFVSAMDTVGLFDRNDLLDPTSQSYSQQVDFIRSQFDTAMAFLWLTTPGNVRGEQINAGRDYVRLNLAATAEGLSMQPFSQALQEYVEMRPHFDRLRTALAIQPQETVQMFVRLGYGGEIGPAPRWPYETRIRSA